MRKQILIDDLNDKLTFIAESADPEIKLDPCLFQAIECISFLLAGYSLTL
jgi:hypothetical protein